MTERSVSRPLNKTRAALTALIIAAGGTIACSETAVKPTTEVADKYKTLESGPLPTAPITTVSELQDQFDAQMLEDVPLYTYEEAFIAGGEISSGSRVYMVGLAQEEVLVEEAMDQALYLLDILYPDGNSDFGIVDPSTRRKIGVGQRPFRQDISFYFLDADDQRNPEWSKRMNTDDNKGASGEFPLATQDPSGAEITFEIPARVAIAVEKPDPTSPTPKTREALERQMHLNFLGAAAFAFDSGARIPTGSSTKFDAIGDALESVAQGYNSAEYFQRSIEAKKPYLTGTSYELLQYFIFGRPLMDITEPVPGQPTLAPGSTHG